jgi:hypothetical protein
LAELVAHNDAVAGSNPAGPTKRLMHIFSESNWICFSNETRQDLLTDGDVYLVDENGKQYKVETYKVTKTFKERW